MSSYRQAGTVLADRTFSVPLDHDRPEGERIEIFAREMVAADRASAGLPWLLFLQGGPGFGAPRPHGRDGWLGRALDDYRVLLLDQRGTGRSTPATRQTLGRFGTAAEQAGYLAHSGPTRSCATRNWSAGRSPEASRGACSARATAASAP
jgi:pimeloyl-ACP methyl ester carboxylesterase